MQTLDAIYQARRHKFVAARIDLIMTANAGGVEANRSRPVIYSSLPRSSATGIPGYADLGANITLHPEKRARGCRNRGGD